MLLSTGIQGFISDNLIFFFLYIYKNKCTFNFLLCQTLNHKADVMVQRFLVLVHRVVPIGNEKKYHNCDK